MEKETYKEIEKIADNLQAAAGRKKCREIERANSFYGVIAKMDGNMYLYRPKRSLTFRHGMICAL